MPYATKKAAFSAFLLIPDMMVMIAGRLLILLALFLNRIHSLQSLMNLCSGEEESQ
jgi:hypothetical protein